MDQETMQALRREYKSAKLDEFELPPAPQAAFNAWFEQAVAGALDMPNAFTLATVGSDGRPDARIVLMKSFDDAGLQFFTDYRSKKAQDLSTHAYACAVFSWGALDRQVRIRGPVSRVSSAASDAYFASRPVGSNLSALASEQSAEIASRSALEARLADVAQTHRDATQVARPEHWGGFLLAPEHFEFWQGREDRLHDRVAYQMSASGWRRGRLMP